MKIIWVLIPMVIVLIFYILMVQKVEKPHFKHPDLTSEQKRMIHKVKGEHGDYPIERRGLGEGNFFMILPNGNRKL